MKDLTTSGCFSHEQEVSPSAAKLCGRKTAVEKKSKPRNRRSLWEGSVEHSAAVADAFIKLRGNVLPNGTSKAKEKISLSVA